MSIEQSDVVARWTVTGLLRGVKPQQLQYVAERLEAANRKVLAGANREIIDRELQALSREGYFGPNVNSRQRW